MIQPQSLSSLWKSRSGTKSSNPLTTRLAPTGNQAPSLDAFQKLLYSLSKRHLRRSQHLGNSKGLGSSAKTEDENQIYIYYKSKYHKDQRLEQKMFLVLSLRKLQGFQSLPGTGGKDKCTLSISPQPTPWSLAMDRLQQNDTRVINNHSHPPYHVESVSQGEATLVFRLLFCQVPNVGVVSTNI